MASIFLKLSLKTKAVLMLSALAFFFSISIMHGAVAQTGGSDPLGNPTGHAPTAPDVKPQNPPVASVGDVINAVVETITEAFEALTKNSDLAAGGKTITYTLFVIVLAWTLLKNMVQGDGVNGLVAEMIPLFGTLAIIQALLESGGIQSIVGFMDSVSSTFGQSGGLGPDITKAAKRGFEAVNNVLTMPSPSTNMEFSLSNIGQGIGMALTAIVGLVARLIAGFLLIIALGVYIANIVLAHGSIMLAVALAPIMVPFMLAPATSFIFDGWLRFTLGAAMIKVVGAFMIGFTDALMGGLSALSAKVMLPADTDWTTLYATNLIIYMGLILMAFLCAYLMMQVPSLATGLLSGSAGGAGFKGMRAITAGSGFQVGKAGAGMATKEAVSATKDVGKAAGRGVTSIKTAVDKSKATASKVPSVSIGSKAGIQSSPKS